MYITFLIIFLLVSIVLISMIMLQQGKNIAIGSSFSTGASATLFGSSGTGNFMTRMIVIFATLFFVMSLVLGNLTSNKNVSGSKWENIGEPSKIEKSIEVLKAPVSPTTDIPH
ncbi:MAG: preprotein translocase subunit SecG [Arsenophonus sp.]